MFPEGRILDFLIVGVVALIVVGPKDLPLLMRKVGQFVARMRAMAAEFRASFDDMARQSELDELRRDVEAMRAGQPLQTAAGLGKDGEVAQVFDDIHASLRSGEAQLHPPMSYQVGVARTGRRRTFPGERRRPFPRSDGPYLSSPLEKYRRSRGRGPPPRHGRVLSRPGDETEIEASRAPCSNI